MEGEDGDEDEEKLSREDGMTRKKMEMASLPLFLTSMMMEAVLLLLL